MLCVRRGTAPLNLGSFGLNLRCCSPYGGLRWDASWGRSSMPPAESVHGISLSREPTTGWVVMSADRGNE